MGEKDDFANWNHQIYLLKFLWRFIYNIKWWMPSKEWICSGTEGFGMKQIGFWVISLAYLSMWKIEYFSERERRRTKLKNLSNVYWQYIVKNYYYKVKKEIPLLHIEIFAGNRYFPLSGILRMISSCEQRSCEYR